MVDVLVTFLSLISGRVRYKFASFWNRNHALRSLQRSADNCHDILEAEKKVILLIVFVLLAKLFSDCYLRQQAVLVIIYP